MPDIVTDISINQNWNARKGANNPVTFTFTQSGSAFNISTYTFSVQLRKFGRSTNLLNLTQGSGITNNGAAGTLNVVFTSANLTNLAADDYYWQMTVVHPDTFSYLWFQGTFNLYTETYTGDLTSAVTGTIDLNGTTINTAITLGVGGGGSMTYPGAGIAVSTGSAWGTSITDNSSNWNTAYGWGDHANSYWPLIGTALLTGTVLVDGDANDLTFNNFPTLSLNANSDINIDAPNITYSNITNFDIGGTSSGISGSWYANDLNIYGYNSGTQLNINQGSGVSNGFVSLLSNNYYNGFRVGYDGVGTRGFGIYTGTAAANKRLWIDEDGTWEVDGTTGSNGDVLTISGGLPTWAAPSGGGLSGLTSTRVPFANSSTTITDDSAFTWDNTDKYLTVDGARLLTQGTNGIKGTYYGYSAGTTTAISNADGFNTAFGYTALSAIQDATSVGVLYEASYNSVFGYQAGQNITKGLSNTLSGYRSGRLLTTSIGSTAYGSNSLRTATTASNNTAIGYNALEDATGAENTAVGSQAAPNVTTGIRNTVVGYIAGQAITQGQGNSLLGSESFELLTTQSYNTGIGFWSGVYVKGSGNTALGAYAVGQATNSTTNLNYNTFVGYGAGLTNTSANASVTGDYNTFLGTESGLGSTTQVSKSTALGYRAKVYSDLSMTFGSEVDADRVNYGFGGESYGGGKGIIFIKNAITDASSSGTSGTIIHAKDSSDANSTLAIYTEQTPEATATFTQTHRVKVWWNGAEYWLSLDAV
jgi:hypothetical protein